MTEIEVKIEIKDIDRIINNITSLGAKLIKDRYLEENTLYDFPNQLLYRQHQALRLRTANKKTFLTFKGAPQKSRKFKIREEYQTEVKSTKNIKKILKELRLVPTFKYKKYRSVYRIHRLKICVDETSFGIFLELEGERNEIVKVANALGFSKREFIKSDYIQLMKQRGVKN
jgi:predicted adenylyl cyclase CyaB